MEYHEDYRPQPTNGETNLVNLPSRISEALQSATTIKKSHFSDGRKVRRKLRKRQQILRERSLSVITPDFGMAAGRDIHSLAQKTEPQRNGHFTYQELDWYSIGTEPIETGLPAGSEILQLQQEIQREYTEAIKAKQRNRTKKMKSMILRWDNLEDQLIDSYGASAINLVELDDDNYTSRWDILKARLP